MSFDTQKLFKQLSAVDFSEKQAEALVNMDKELDVQKLENKCCDSVKRTKDSKACCCIKLEKRLVIALISIAAIAVSSISIFNSLGWL